MDNVTSSVSIGQQEAPQPDDQVIPLIGGEMDLAEIKANFNALLYLMTEQMSIQLKLMEVLVEQGTLTGDQMNDKVLSVTGNKEELTTVYNELFGRFVGYYTSISKLMADGKVFQAEPVEPNAN